MAVPPEERFSSNVQNLLELTKECVETVAQHGYNIISPALIDLAGAALNQYDKTCLIEMFIKYSHKHWEQIREKNEEFFIKHAGDIFGDLPMGNIDAFKKLFTLTDKDGKPVIDEDLREDLWVMFSSLVRVCINYIHEGRSMNDESEYEFEFFEEVDLVNHANKWGMRLECKK